MITVAWILALFIALVATGLVAGAVRTRWLARQAERLVPQSGHVQHVGGGRIHFVETGIPGRTPVILIHGLAGQLRHFTYALAAQLADEFHVIALDRPGCGYSTRDSDEMATLPEQARMITEFLKARALPPAVLVGHSLGGAVALATALDHPDRVSGLALLCPLTHPVPSTPAVFRPLTIRNAGLRRLLGRTIAAPLSEWTAASVLKEVFAPEPWPEDFLTRAGGALGLRPEAYMAASADLLHSSATIAAQAARYDELAVPGAILYGQDDAILEPHRHGATMAGYGLECRLLAGRGHMIPLTAPKDCAEFIRDVAKRARPAGQD